MIRVELPFHLRNLAGIGGEVELEVAEPPSVAGVLDALEARFPTLRGTIRGHGDGRRRPKVRFYADQRDISLEPLDAPLPDTVVSGAQPLRIIGAISGG